MEASELSKNIARLEAELVECKEKLLTFEGMTFSEPESVESVSFKRMREEIARLKAENENANKLLDQHVLNWTNLNSELKSLREKLKVAVEALERIALTDVSAEVPDFAWLQQWRHQTKNCANYALKHLDQTIEVDKIVEGE